MDPLFIKSIMIHWDKVPKDSYVRRIRSLKGLECLSFQSPVTFFVGENGSGKSTLLEAMAVSYGFNPEGGTMNVIVSGRKASITLRQRRWIIRQLTIFINSLTAKALWK